MTRIIRSWKPSDVAFEDHDYESICICLGAPREEVKWDVIEVEIIGDMVGHTLIGSHG